MKLSLALVLTTTALTAVAFDVPTPTSLVQSPTPSSATPSASPAPSAPEDSGSSVCPPTRHV